MCILFICCFSILILVFRIWYWLLLIFWLWVIFLLKLWICFFRGLSNVGFIRVVICWSGSFCCLVWVLFCLWVFLVFLVFLCFILVVVCFFRYFFSNGLMVFMLYRLMKLWLLGCENIIWMLVFLISLLIIDFLIL